MRLDSMSSSTELGRTVGATHAHQAVWRRICNHRIIARMWESPDHTPHTQQPWRVGVREPIDQPTRMYTESTRQAEACTHRRRRPMMDALKNSPVIGFCRSDIISERRRGLRCMSVHDEMNSSTQAHNPWSEVALVISSARDEAESDRCSRPRSTKCQRVRRRYAVTTSSCMTREQKMPIMLTA